MTCPGPPMHTRATLRVSVICLIGVITALLTAPPAAALLSIDFEQPYYVHDGWQVWDFCLIEHEDLYRIFYLAVPESDADPMASDSIWMASSPDLIHWSEPQAVLSVSWDAWEAGAVWAPDVVFDEVSGKWWMAYTGVALNRSQSICMASSEDLVTWTKSAQNPVVSPDHPPFFYFPDNGWAECRDPYLYHKGDRWHMLATVKTDDLENGRGALLHAASMDLETWTHFTVFMDNDGETPGRALESSQYHEITGAHHLIFHEYGSQGVTWIGSEDPEQWTFDLRVSIDSGIAPEVDSFDGGESWLLSRAAPYQDPTNPVVSVVTRFDELGFRQGTVAPTVRREDPWLRDFAEYGGSICLGNPCFGDNAAARGEAPAGTVGWGYLGTREYFRGPLSNRGAAGTQLGKTATGFLRSHDFVVEGTAMRFLMGGSEQPEQCYMALVDAEADTTLRHASGQGAESMTLRWWDLSALQGRTVYLYIADTSTEGYLDVDEIHETLDDLTAVPVDAPAVAGLRDAGARPNPFNPQTTLHFSLDRATTVDAEIYDLRGRRIWSSGSMAGRVGENTVAWTGVDAAGRTVPGGVYIYRIATSRAEVVSGKLTLIP